MIPRRRLLSTLSAAGALAVASGMSGCVTGAGGGGSDSGGSGAPTPKVYPDLKLLASLIEEKGALVALYDSVVRSDPKASETLKPYADRHRRHLAALKARAKLVGHRPATASPSPSSGGKPPAAGDLAKLEREAADAHREQLRKVDDGRLAQLIAAMAACETLHAEALR